MGLNPRYANELAPYGITDYAIAPGYMATDKPLRCEPFRNAIRRSLSAFPADAGGSGDLQGVAVFLASAASDYLNGYTVAVDGGWLAR
jgi:2-deoxy-D-gluconate 3-dehydrogenase